MKANRGAAGVDARRSPLEHAGVERMLDELHAVLHTGTYRPLRSGGDTSRRPDGRQRPLGIPTVRDRVVQMAATMVLEPIFEADFLASSYGFRPRNAARPRRWRRCACMAREAVTMCWTRISATTLAASTTPSC